MTVITGAVQQIKRRPKTTNWLTTSCGGGNVDSHRRGHRAAETALAEVVGLELRNPMAANQPMRR
jgi:hypothetical protein